MIIISILLNVSGVKFGFGGLVAKGTGRKPQNINKVPFEEVLPLRLRPFITGKGDGSSDVACLFEMSVLFACLKENDFHQQSCSKEIGTFQKCYNDHLVSKNAKKTGNTTPEITPKNERMGYKQVNKVLKRYPPVSPLPPR